MPTVTFRHQAACLTFPSKSKSSAMAGVSVHFGVEGTRRCLLQHRLLYIVQRVGCTDIVDFDLLFILFLYDLRVSRRYFAILFCGAKAKYALLWLDLFHGKSCYLPLFFFWEKCDDFFFFFFRSWTWPSRLEAVGCGGTESYRVALKQKGCDRMPAFFGLSLFMCLNTLLCVGYKIMYIKYHIFIGIYTYGIVCFSLQHIGFQAFFAEFSSNACFEGTHQSCLVLLARGELNVIDEELWPDVLLRKKIGLKASKWWKMR